MENVRLGIIGYGNMGSSHAKKVFDGQVKNMELTAICDINPEKINLAKSVYGDNISYFDNDEAFFNEKDKFDSVIIATPHYSHPELTIRSLKEGLHTICEKPIGVYTKAIKEVNAIAQSSDRVFGIMYNQRTNPMYQKLRDLVQSGELGNLKRIIWIITNWYRSQSYHDSGGWRSTWEGEGGGVLLNQDPHQLDLWQWIFGMPKRIRGFCYFGKYYNIEVEDDVTAYAEYENGMSASFITTTGETPGTNRLEVSGDMGKIVIEDGKMTFWRNRVSEREFNRTWDKGFGNPEVWQCSIPVEGGEGTAHVGIFQDFTNAVLKGTPLLAPGIEGINGLTISNAIHLSSWIDNWVELPLDEDLFYEKLQEKIKNSTYVKKATEKLLDTSGTH